MRKTLLLTVWTALLALSRPADASSPAGYWHGEISLPGTPLEIRVTLNQEAAGNWNGKIDIPGQGLTGFGLGEITVKEDAVRFIMPGIPGEPTFEGGFNAQRISGTFRQSGQEFGFSLEAGSPPESSKSTGIPGNGFPGEWLGTIQSGPVQLRLALSLESSEEGLSATLDSLDQGSMVPVASAIENAGELVLSMPAIAGEYRGIMNEDGSAVEGTWKQSGQEIALTFLRQERKLALKRPQEPQPPYPYTVEEVSFENSEDAVTLAGTLIIPEGSPPFPGVVFISGSGPQDRDEFLLGHRPFLVIADHLARNGIASLRYDDRGAGQSEGDHMGSSIDQFLADAQAAVKLLEDHPSVNAVGIVGHSEGGVTGPRLAVQESSVEFLVLLAPPAVPITELLARQSRDLLTAQGVDPELMDKSLKDQAQDLEFIAQSTLDTDELSRVLQERFEERREDYSADERAALGINDATMQQSLAMATSAWFRSLLKIDPADFLPELAVPVLAVFGEKDIQVAADDNVDRLQELTKATAARVDIHRLAGLNHLLQEAETGTVEEYGQIEETINPEVLAIMTEWILEVTDDSR